jgi:hypothetical protein
LVSRRLPDIGVLANLVEFPAVPKGQARFRMQVMASHSSRDIIDAVHRLSVATAEATRQHAALLDGTADFDTIDALVRTGPERTVGNIASVRSSGTPALAAEYHERDTRRAANG